MTDGTAGNAKQIALQIPARQREHKLTLVAARVAFYAFLAFVPALVMIVTVYGLVATPADIQRQVHDFAGALPDEVQGFIEQQISSIGSASGAGVSVTLLIAVALALWSASGGVAELVSGVNVAREQDEPKSFLKKRGKALPAFRDFARNAWPLRGSWGAWVACLPWGGWPTSSANGMGIC